MERLTELSGKHKLIKDGISITAVANKLYDYEDTNLTPAEIKELVRLNGTLKEPPENAKSLLHITEFDHRLCNVSIVGSTMDILELIAFAIRTMANKDEEKENKLLAMLFKILLVENNFDIMGGAENGNV